MSTQWPQEVQLVYFLQPTTIPPTSGDSWAPQAVLSLAAEIPSEGASGKDTSPFGTVVEGVGRWLHNEYADPSKPLAQQVAAMDKAVRPPPGTHSRSEFSGQVDACLHEQFTFSISPGSTSADAAGQLRVAVFPMFPELAYSYPPVGTIDFGDQPLPQGYLQEIGAYFSGPVEGEAGDADGQGSYAGKVREDYFVLLARQLVADLQDYVDTTEQSKQSFEGALEAVDVAGVAGVASRFLQHGLRLPGPGGAGPQEGLYQRTRQQVALQRDSSSSEEGGGTTTPPWVTEVTLKPGPSTGGWIKLDGPDDEITEKLPVELVDGLTAPVGPSWFTGQLTALEPLNEVPLRYTLIHPITVCSGQQTLSARQLSPGLQAEIATAITRDDATVHLGVVEGDDAGTTRTSYQAPLAAPGELDAAPALLARIGIRQVQKEGAPPGTFYEDVYQLQGTDEQTRGRIDALLDQGGKIASVDLLLPQGHSSYRAADKDNLVMLAKANLSTVAEPATARQMARLAREGEPVSPDHATPADVEGFLRLIWECSVVHTGGFFLHCEHIPSGQFTRPTGPGGQEATKDAPAGGRSDSTAPGEASLYVLVNSSPFGTLPGDEPAVAAYHNTLLLAAETEKKAVTTTVLVTDRNGETTAVSTWHPNYPAGGAGFQVTWQDAPWDLAPLRDNYPQEQVSAYARMLYHFLQYRVAGLSTTTTDSLPTTWSAPNGPASIDEGDGEHSWYYRQSKAVAELIGPDANRYAAVGDEVEFDVRLLDVFGNTLPAAATQQLTATVVYNDPLYSLDQWPGVDIAYTINAGSPDPMLTVRLTYTKPSKTTGSGNAQQRERTYGLILSQLEDPHCSVCIATTLEAQPITRTSAGEAIASELTAYAERIRQSLTGGEADGDGTGPLTLELTLELSDSFAHIRSRPADLFVVAVEAVVARASGALDPAIVAELPKVGIARYALSPDTSAGGSGGNGGDGNRADRTRGSRVFAEAFEAAYAGFDGADGRLKVGTGPEPSSRSELNATAGDDDRHGDSTTNGVIWALRWSTSSGMDVSFPNDAEPDPQQRPAYFAPPPLSTELLTRRVAVRDYGEQPTSSEQRFSGVDLDGWMRRFLATLHGLFAPEMAPAIAALDGDAYTQLINDKEAIAEELAGRLANVFTTGEPEGPTSAVPAGDREIAQEVFRQALLTNLANDYDTAAVVQVPAEIDVTGKLESAVAGHGTETIPARLYGQVSTNRPEQETSPYTISSAFLPVPQGETTGYPTFLVAAKHAKRQADLNLQLFYDIGFLEHDFLTLEGHYGYIPSSWITFTLPKATPKGAHHPTLAPPMGEVEVPIPLRSYPESPVLFKQTATTAGPGDDPLEELSWSYELTVSTLLGVAQDELLLEVIFNDLVKGPTPAGQEPAASGPASQDDRDPPRDLFAALARVEWEYPQLASALATIPDQTGVGTDDPTDGQAARQALNRMVDLVAGVRTTLGNWTNPAHPDQRARRRALASQPSDAVPHFTWSYRITYARARDGSRTDNLKVTRERDSTGLLPPWPEIGGYQAPTSTTDDTGIYRAEDGRGSNDRWTFTWSRLYLMTHQSARTSARIERNDDLSEHAALETNPAFVYTTPEVTFGSPVIPQLDWEQPVDQPTAATSEQALGNVFNAFTRPDPEGRKVRRLGFSLETTYEYVVADDDSQGQLTTRTPIFLVQEAVTTGAAGEAAAASQLLTAFEQGAAQALRRWHDTEHPNPTDAYVALRLTVFASVVKGHLPLASFREIRLPVGDDDWWSPGTS